jgi:hypothetical protein
MTGTHGTDQARQRMDRSAAVCPWRGQGTGSRWVCRPTCTQSCSYGVGAGSRSEVPKVPIGSALAPRVGLDQGLRSTPC